MRWGGGSLLSAVWHLSPSAGGKVGSELHSDSRERFADAFSHVTQMSPKGLSVFQRHQFKGGHHMLSLALELCLLGQLQPLPTTVCHFPPQC